MIQVFGGVDYGCASNLAAVVIDEYIPHDCEDPSFEVDVVNVFGFVVEHFEGCVLNKILCCVTVGGQLVCKVQKVALKAEETVFERVVVRHVVEF